MTNKLFLKLLTKIDACHEAVDWIKKDKLTLKQAWDKCERADWLIWFAVKTEMASHQEIVLVACDCAETALEYVPKGEDRPRKAIEAARQWALNPTAANAANAAAYAAYAANAAYAAAYAANAAAYAAYAANAANAANAAAYAAAYAANAANAANAAAYAAAYAVANAANAAAYAAAYAVANAAKQKELCKIVRERIKIKRNCALRGDKE